jgi:wobble nucleotide-excising tRNase
MSGAVPLVKGSTEDAMLKKIVAIKNVGRFKNSAAGGDTHFNKHTLIHGANGQGKTTICTILRSLKTGNADHVLGRTTLGSTQLPDIHLLMEGGNHRFNGKTWSGTHPHLAIFDSIFIGENVHSGDVVDTEQKRGLYRVIVGEAGVILAEEEAQLAADGRTKTSEITAAEKAIKSHLPPGGRLDTFLELPKIEDVEGKITAQESKLKTVTEAATIKARPTLVEVKLPSLPAELEAVLAATIDSVADDAEERIAAHLAAHGMTETGRAWVNEGLEHAGEDCPFCGQDIEGAPLVASYRAVFGEGYKQLKIRVSAMRSQIDLAFGEAAASKITLQAEQFRNGLEFWSQHAPLDLREYPSTASAAMLAVHSALDTLLEKKENAPLEPIELNSSSRTAVASYAQEQEKVRAFNTDIGSANRIITAKKIEAGDGNTVPIKTELDRLKATKIRHSQNVAQLCNERAQAIKDKAAIDVRKATVRGKLDTHTASVVRPYQNRINDLLDNFNAGFTIAETQHSYAGGVATSSYRLVINKKAIDVGAGNTPTKLPSFRNTLSAGDRSTLALAFFIAYLECDRNLATSIVVFDDPFNSQDAFRRKQTIHEILKIGRKCAQVIVLSHDATFLKQIWEKCDTGGRAAIGIVDHGQQGSKIMVIDLEKACQGRTANDIDDLLSYHHDRAGKPIDVVRKMRTILETYLRTTFPAEFLEKEWLGDMIKKIRLGGASHPAHHLYDELNEINESAQYHHGENLSDTTPDQLDPQELGGLVKRTLRIVNAIQA